jgi:CRP/FNR family cyclic AMP-dependent transcriptional regulator
MGNGHDAMPLQITPGAREISRARPYAGVAFEQRLETPSPQCPEEHSGMKTPGERPFDPKALLAKVDGRSVSKYQKRQIIFSQGDDADGVFYIQSGKVKTTVLSEHGKEAVVAILNSGDFFGEGCLAGRPKRVATVAAMTECSVVWMEKTAILRALRDQRAFSEMFISHLLVRNIRIEEDLVDQLFNSSEIRLARALLLLANFGKDDQSIVITPKISQETLADMIGTTRARVSFFMNRFRKQGFISYKGKLEIHSSLLKVLLTAHDHDIKRKRRSFE